jgi:mutator protein MutT
MLKRTTTIGLVISAFILFIFMQNYQPKNKLSIAVAIIEKNGKVLIAKRVGKDDFGPKWSFVGGRVERDEALHECLERELKEELNIKAEIGDYFGTNSFYHNGVQYELHAFNVNHFTGHIKLNDEHTEFAWVTPKALSDYDMIDSNLPFVKQLQEK